MGLKNWLDKLLGREVGKEVGKEAAPKSESPEVNERRRAAARAVEAAGVFGVGATRAVFTPEVKVSGPKAKPIAPVLRANGRGKVGNVEVVPLPVYESAEEQISDEFFAEPELLAEAMRTDPFKGLFTPNFVADNDDDEELKGLVCNVLDRVALTGVQFDQPKLLQRLERFYLELGLMDGDAPLFTTEKMTKLWPELERDGKYLITSGKNGDLVVLYIYKNYGTGGQKKLFQIPKPKYLRQWVDLLFLKNQLGEGGDSTTFVLEG